MPRSRLERRASRVALAAVRIFAQRAELSLDLPELLRATRTYFDATLDVLSQAAGTHDVGDRVEVELRSTQHGYVGRFSIRARRTSEHDLADARDAEQRGRAAGMAALAERCPSIWEVEPLAEDSELARLNLCGILASVALGPVLPDDCATLYGVRGSMERVARLLETR
ncbi:MAG: hypothetical protein ABUL62_06555 [Myxococcales bacterium]